jgi:hypothetical protein
VDSSQAVLLAPELAVFAVLFAQLLGIPTAWLRVRRTREWAERPRNVGRVSLLERFVGAYLGAAGIYGAVVGLAVLLGSVLA